MWSVKTSWQKRIELTCYGLLLNYYKMTITRPRHEKVCLQVVFLQQQIITVVAVVVFLITGAGLHRKLYRAMWRTHKLDRFQHNLPVIFRGLGTLLRKSNCSWLYQIVRSWPNKQIWDVKMAGINSQYSCSCEMTVCLLYVLPHFRVDKTFFLVCYILSSISPQKWAIISMNFVKN